MTSKQVSAIIEADRNGEIHLPEGSYTAAELREQEWDDANRLEDERERQDGI
jgi:hypothetical protein